MSVPRFSTRVATRAIGAVFVLAAAIPAFSATPDDRRIAITIDDLPWAGLDDAAYDDLPAHHDKLIAALKAANAPVTAFVNEHKLEVDGKVQPARVKMLHDWLELGLKLGNHTYSHADLHRVGLDAYEAEILRGEQLLRPLLAEYQQEPRWFRHPYLHAGMNVTDKAALVQFLGQHGYAIAPITVDNSDWIWARAYRRILNEGGDRETLAKMRTEYVPYMLAKVAYYEKLSIGLFGRKIAQTWLMHANEINAETFDELVAGVRALGYATVSLDEAMQDPVYRRVDGYVEQYGPSWMHRWALDEHKPIDFYKGEPRTPKWIMTLAGVDSE